MTAFTGEFPHTLDAKGRVILPARCREQLADGIYLSKAPERALQVWSIVGFNRQLDKMREWEGGDPMKRKFMRVFLSGAHQDTPDSQGRITIPPKLRQYARLERDLTIIGQGERLEIWDRAAWDAFLDEADEGFANLDVPW